MTQNTTGIRSFLSASHAYDALQNLLGARRSRTRIVAEYIRARSTDRILDVGCGTAAILDHLPEGVTYYGIDLSDEYITTARQRYGDRGHFHCVDISGIDAVSIPKVNIALAVGLLHHLEDHEVTRLLQSVSQRLVAGGRLITVDPCYSTGQSRVARFFISRDRGGNVRAPSAYADLARPHFPQVDTTVRSDLARIPYTHTILECRTR